MSLEISRRKFLRMAGVATFGTVFLGYGGTEAGGEKLTPTKTPVVPAPEIGKFTIKNGKITAVEVDGAKLDVVPLPTSHFIVVKENGRAVKKTNPGYGVYEGSSADTRIGSFDLIGIVVRTDSVDVQTTDENSQEITTTLHRVYMVIPKKDGTVKKVRLWAYDFININTVPADWEDASRILKPGYVIDAGVVNYDNLNWTDEQLKQGIDTTNQKYGMNITVASMKAWVEKMKGSVDIIKGISASKSSEWIDIGGLSGFGISNR